MGSLYLRVRCEPLSTNNKFPNFLILLAVKFQTSLGFDYIDFTVVAVEFARFFVVRQRRFFCRGKHPDVNRFAIDGNDRPVAIIFFVHAGVTCAAAGFALTAGNGARAINEVFQSAIEFVAVAGTHQIGIVGFTVAQKLLCHQFVQVDGFRFVAAVCFFPGFLKNSTPAGVAAQVVDKIHFQQVRVGTQVLIHLVIQQNVVFRIFKFNFVQHAFRVLAVYEYVAPLCEIAGRKDSR